MNIGYIEPFQFFLNKSLDISDQPLDIGDGLHLLSSDSITTSAYCLDDFESSLKLSQRLLLCYQKNLLLLQAKTSGALKQKCPAKWRFISQLDDGVVKRAIDDCSPIRAFLPGIKNTLLIEQYIVLDDDQKTNARCTLYCLTNANSTLTFGVTQALRGYDAEHALLQQFLCEQGAIEFNSFTEIYSQCGFDSPVYYAKPKLDIAVDDPAIETASHLINVSLDIARQNEEGIKADYDTEFLHDYRVNLRKVRSVLSLFKGVYSEAENTALKQDFSDIMKATNRLRDLDVYLLDKQELFSLLPVRMHTGLKQMFDVFTIERKKQLQLVIKKLNSKSYQHKIKVLQDKFKLAEKVSAGPKALTASLPFATKLIWKRYAKVCQIAKQIDENTPDEQAHELRIQCKKLRYLMEFFTSLFPKKMLKDLIKSLKRLQDNLGRFNDYSVQHESLQVFLTSYSTKHPNKNLIAMAESIGALIILLQQKQSLERAQVMQSFSSFDSHEIREEFSEIFHHGTNQ